MYKSELIKRISRKTGIPEIDVELSLKAFAEVIVEGAKTREVINCRFFGTITYRKKNARIVKSNIYKKDFPMPAYYKAWFRLSDNIQRQIYEATKGVVEKEAAEENFRKAACQDEEVQTGS